MGIFNKFLNKKQDSNQEDIKEVKGQESNDDKEISVALESEKVDGVEALREGEEASKEKETNIVEINKQPIKNKPELIFFYDEYGRKMQVPKEVWKNKVLPNQLKSHWENPNLLYQDIIGAIGQKMANEVAEAAEHLIEIDSNKERATHVLAIILMEQGNCEKAKDILIAYLEEHDKSALILSTLATAYQRLKDEAKTEETLWECLQVNPNQGNALTSLATIKHNKEGRDGYIELLNEVKVIPGSWLAHVLLAREYLKCKDVEVAKKIYNEVIDVIKDSSEALINISSDLGRGGYPQEVIAFLEPLYHFDRHDIRVGTNLLYAYLTTEELEKGEALLHLFMCLERPDLKEQLMQMSQGFEALRRKKIKPVQKENPKVNMLAFNKPVWYYGLNAPSWLMPSAERTTKVALVPYADLAKVGAQSNESQIEDQIGKLTRSISAYLGEVVMMTTSCDANVVIPFVEEVGPAITNQPYTEEMIKDIIEQIKSDYLVTGNISAKEGSLQIDTFIYSVKDSSMTIVNKQLTEADYGKAFNEMVEEIVAALGDRIEISSPLYKMPADIEAKRYVMGVGQGLVQTFLMNKYIERDGLWGERNILNWNLNMMLTYPNNPTYKLLHLSGLSKSRAYGSNCYLEFKKQTIHIFRKDEEMKLLMPFVYKIFGLEEEYVKAKEACLAENSDELYKTWLETL